VYNWKTEKNAAKNYYFLLHNMYDLGQSGTVMEYCFKGVMVFNTTFNNISVISWWSVLLVEETRVHGKNL
jgi:hypothetical protein